MEYERLTHPPNHVVNRLDPELAIITGQDKSIDQLADIFVGGKRIDGQIVERRLLQNVGADKLLKLRFDGAHVPTGIARNAFRRVRRVRVVMKKADEIPFDERIDFCANKLQ